MIKRIVFLIVWLLSFPLVCISVFVGLLILLPIGAFIWIIKGGDSERMLDWSFTPLDFCINLPYKITGQDS